MIVLVLPAYNEAEGIGHLIARAHDTFANLDDRLRIIVVDDGSSDETGAAAARAVTPGDRFALSVIRHDVNRGLHAAVDTGLRAALDSCDDDDFVVLMDADDTHPPALMPQMVMAARSGADVVIASRFRRGSKWYGRQWDRVLFSYAVAAMFKIVWPIRGVRDYTCGFRLYRSSLLRRAYTHWGSLLICETSFACMPDILFKISRLRPTMIEVPLVLRYDRKAGISKMNVWQTVRRTIVLLFRRRIGMYD